MGSNEVDIKVIWKDLDAYEKELDKEAKSLQDIWTKICQLHAKTEDEIASLHALPELTFVPSETEIRLNVGGQIFESTCEVLTKDPYSILAACCRVDTNVPTCADGETFFFDRDWWLFRHILSYLRSNVLPRELETLRELYTESSFFRLESLRKSIEEMPVHEVITPNDVSNPPQSNSSNKHYASTKSLI